MNTENGSTELSKANDSIFSVISTVNIEGCNLSKIAYMGHPVVTCKMIDEVHERPVGTAKRSFHTNQDKFTENEDFFRLPFDEWKTIPAGHSLSRGQDTGQRNPMLFFTAIGYMMLVKSFTDDRAWKVQKALAKTYFANHQSQIVNKAKKKEAAIKREELSILKAQSNMEKQAKEEALMIHNGQKTLDDLNDYPNLKSMTEKALEFYKNQGLSEDNIVDRLNAIVAAYAAYQKKPVMRHPLPYPELDFTHSRNDDGNIESVVFISRPVDILEALNWLQENKNMSNPYESTAKLSSVLTKTFNKPFHPVPWWQVNTRFKKIKGSWYFRFEKMLKPDLPAISNNQE